MLAAGEDGVAAGIEIERSRAQGIRHPARQFTDRGRSTGHRSQRTAIDHRARSAHAPLFRDFRKEEQEYYRKTGIFPTSHIVTLKQSFVDKHPTAPVALLKAFRQSRDVAFDRLMGPDPQIIVYSWMAAAVAEQRELMGDNYWPYNVNENVKALEAITSTATNRDCRRHGSITRRFSIRRRRRLQGRDNVGNRQPVVVISEEGAKWLTSSG